MLARAWNNTRKGTRGLPPPVKLKRGHIYESQGWNPICISKMSIGKNYMWISGAPDVKHNARWDRKNTSIAGYVFIFFNIYLKFSLFFKENRNVILPSWFSTILPIFVLDIYAVFIEIFFPSWVLVCPKHAMWIKKMSLNGLKKQRFYEISLQADA
jgi:hypothetical protein